MVVKSDKKLSVSQQCKLLGISRLGLYYVHRGESKRNLEIMRAIDRIHTDYPFYGYWACGGQWACRTVIELVVGELVESVEMSKYGFRRIRSELRTYGFNIGKKLVIRLMKLMAIDVIFPKQNTSVPCSGYKIYPYLLRGLTIERCHQVWQTVIERNMDITYVPISHCFMYLAAIIDVHSSLVVGWDVSLSQCIRKRSGTIRGVEGVFWFLQMYLTSVF